MFNVSFLFHFGMPCIELKGRFLKDIRGRGNITCVLWNIHDCNFIDRSQYLNISHHIHESKCQTFPESYIEHCEYEILNNKWRNNLYALLWQGIEIEIKLCWHTRRWNYVKVLSIYTCSCAQLTRQEIKTFPYLKDY